MSEIPVPRDWLLATIRLLNELAGEGIFIQNFADPADLMVDIARHFGVQDADDSWAEAIAVLTQKSPDDAGLGDE